MKTVLTIMPAILLAVVISALLPAWGQQGPSPETSLHVAALVGDVDAVRQHIEAGADLARSSRRAPT